LPAQHDAAADATAALPSPLVRLGLDAELFEQLSRYDADGRALGRVSRVDRGALTVLTEHGPVRASARREGARATVGDWIAVRPDGPDGLYEVVGVAERRSSFVRRAPGDATEEQVVAANVDVAFIVISLAAKLSPRRTERYLALAWQSGATPVLVLSKADLCAEPELALASVEAVAFGVPVILVSSVTGEGIDELRSYVTPGRTLAFLGVSGVGKSTLVNTLAGAEVLRTQDVRSDGKGRHTTTHRELVQLPGGGVLLDTPGMRGMLLWDASEGVEQAFGDVEELAAECRFHDCAHESEPGCAVTAALRDGRLSLTRFESWRLLQRELRNLEMRQNHRLRAEERRKWRIQSKAMRLRERLGD
jgi:ribosome biogenesis GTPase / thiamine phosphate phosphatase